MKPHDFSHNPIFYLFSLKLTFQAMAQRQKVLETDSATAKFLYTIIKQLDLKSVCLLTDHLLSII